MSDHARNSIRFVPGGATAVVGSRFIALVAELPGHQLVQALQHLITHEEVTEQVIVALSSAARSDELPAFAVMLQEAHGVRAFVRGGIVLDFDVGDSERGLRRLGAGDVRTWREESLEHCRVARLSTTESGAVDFDGTLYTAALGVLPAAGVEISWSSGDADVQMPSPEGDVNPPLQTVNPAEDVVGGMAGLDNLVEPNGAELAGIPTGVPTAALRVPTERLSALEGVDEAPPTSAEPAAPDPPTAITESPVASVGGDSPPEDQRSELDPALTGDYDELFGETQQRSVESAAVRVAPRDLEESHGAPLPAEPPVGSAAHAAAADPTHDGKTISIEDLRRIKGEGRPFISTDSIPGIEGGPSVLSVSCVTGHPNAPHDVQCRICGDPIPAQKPVSVLRPALGRFVFSTGQRVVVDKPMLIGRSPKVSGAVPGGHIPELVQVDSPDKDVSRTHLEVRVEGWQVFVVDQNSANGTVVELPGRPPLRLRPNDPCLLTFGAVVRLAEEVEFKMEAIT